MNRDNSVFPFGFFKQDYREWVSEAFMAGLLSLVSIVSFRVRRDACGWHSCVFPGVFGNYLAGIIRNGI